MYFYFIIVQCFLLIYIDLGDVEEKYEEIADKLCDMYVNRYIYIIFIYYVYMSCVLNIYNG